MNKKAVLLLQGGGALGAFECGTWKVLFPFLRENGYELVAVAGASIGAVNAGLIASHFHDPDGGRGQLEDFWCNTVATPSAPFFPLPGEYWRAWNGLLTGLLLGNRALFSPAYQHWNPVGDLFRFHMPMYQTHRAEQTLADAFGKYHGQAPLLVIGATDVKTGEAVLFDSASRTITPRMLAASLAIPLLFPPIEIDGRYYWDGEMRSNTLLPDVFALLHETLPPSASPDHFLVIIVDVFKQDTDRTPISAIESHYRFLNVLLGGKLKYDQGMFEVGNAYLDAIKRIRDLADGENPSPLTVAIEEEYQKVLAERHGRVELLHIGRRQFEYEHISRDFDYSPPYIARLMEQGFECASNAVKDYQETTRPDKKTGKDGVDEAPRRTGDTRRAYPRLVQMKE